MSATYPAPPRDNAARRRSKRLYGSKAWRKIRLQVLARDLWACHWCGGEATVCDHLIRPEDGGMALDPLNLVAACRSCNILRHHGNLGYRTGQPSPGQPARNPLVVPSGFGASRPATESPRILSTGSGRPQAGDVERYLAWALSLPLGAEPDDHRHGRWATSLRIHHRRQVFGICPASCDRAPVRWVSR